MSDKSKINSNLSISSKNDFSKTTKNLVQNLENFSLDYDLNFVNKYVKNKDLEKYVSLIYNLYKKIDYNLEVTDCDNIEKNSNLCNTFELLSYLRNDNNINDYYNKTIDYKNDKISLHNIIDNKHVDGCKVWINLHGKMLLRNIFVLKQMGKLPKELLENVDNIDKDLFSEFTPIDIFEYVSNNSLIKLNLKITMENLTLNLKLVSKKKLRNKEINNIIKRICLLYLLKHKNDKKHSNISLTIIFTNAKKSLPKEYKVLGTREVNSGLASFGDNKILIYRNEEYSKLLIHELIHLYRIDFSVVNIDFLPELLDINNDTKTIPNESITEILAVIINSIIVSIEFSKKKNTKLATDLINYEIAFNLFQCSKILNHFGYNYATDFFKSNNGNSIFEQTTSVVSYFFIKTACLFNTPKLLKFLNNNFTELNYDNLEEAKKNYVSLVKESLQNKTFHDKIDEIMEAIEESKHYTFFYNNLRMTCIEIE
jgi:hypothetical protein